MIFFFCAFLILRCRFNDGANTTPPPRSHVSHSQMHLSPLVYYVTMTRLVTESVIKGHPTGCHVNGKFLWISQLGFRTVFQRFRSINKPVSSSSMEWTRGCGRGCMNRLEYINVFELQYQPNNPIHPTIS